jgi:DNA-binding beta-propeller fold protein YncE
MLHVTSYLFHVAGNMLQLLNLRFSNMKASVTVRTWISSLLLASLLVGCVGKQEGTLQTASPRGKLYISNFGDNSLLIYGDAINADGNLAPTEKIQDLRAQNVIRNPFSVFVDVVNDRLYVANTGFNQILMYDNASTVSGNAAPDHVISGNDTTLDFPRGLTAGAKMTTINHTTSLTAAIASTAMIIPVASTTDFPTAGTIYIDNELISYTGLTGTSFTGATRGVGLTSQANHSSGATVTGGLSSTATTIPVVSTTGFPASGRIRIENEIISYTGLTATSFTGAARAQGGTTAANHLSRALIVSGVTILYVSNTGGNSILSFDVSDAVLTGPSPTCTVSGSTTTCNLPPIQTFTGLSRPWGLYLDDTNDRLYVANEGQTSSILVFDNASNPATLTPTRTITFSNSNSLTIPRLSDPSSIFVDVNADPDENPTNGTGVIYVANNGNNSILVFNNASNIDGETVPDRSISGTQTDLSDPAGIFVDNYARVFSRSTNPDSFTNLIDNNQAFASNQFVNFIVAITGGTGQGQARTIISNTATQLNVSPNWTIRPNADSIYQIRANFLYAANNSTSSILGFNNASTVSGNTPPDRIITGSSTLLSDPEGIFIANVNPPNGLGVLYTMNFANNSITVYNDAGSATTTGNISPNRTVFDATLTPLAAPGGNAVDVTRDLLYVAEPGAIVIFDHASTLVDTIPPVANRISVPSLTSSPFAISVDSTQDRLYAATPGSVLVFDSASGLMGSPVPALTISSGLTNPVGLFVDTAQNHLYVADSTSVFVFDSVTGSSVPALTISGFTNPAGLSVDSARDLLYVSDSGTNSIFVFSRASTSPTLLHTINGILTTLNSPSGIFVDPGNDLLYVANSGANSILIFENASSRNGDIAPDSVIAQGANPSDNTTLNLPLGIFVDTTR